MIDFTIPLGAGEPVPEAYQHLDLFDLRQVKDRHFFLPFAGHKPFLLERRTAAAADAFLAAALHAGFKTLVIMHTLKQPESQGAGLPSAPDEFIKPLQSPECATGLVFSVACPEAAKSKNAANWLTSHCAEYGLILRFPLEKSHVTHVVGSSWVFRFVGLEPAREMYENNWCLEEYHAVKCFGDVVPSRAEQLRQRCFFAEGLLRRIAASANRDNLVVYGSPIITSIVGLDNRAFCDIDVLVRNTGGASIDATEIVKRLIAIDVGDGIRFSVIGQHVLKKKQRYSAGVQNIGTSFDIVTELDGMKNTIGIDAVVGIDMSIPPVDYAYKLQFDKGTLPIKAPCPEEILADKLSELVSSGMRKIRVKDLYDICILTTSLEGEIDFDVCRAACFDKAANKGCFDLYQELRDALDFYRDSPAVADAWEFYQREYYFAKGHSWQEIMDSVDELSRRLLGDDFL